MTNRGSDHENALPPAVAAQVARADALIAEMNGGEPAAEPAPVVADPAPVVADPAPAPTPAPAAAAPAPAAAPTPAPKEDWKQKYLVLKGKYDHEVPRLHEDLRNNSGQMRQMQEQVNSLTATIGAMNAVKTPEPAPQPQVTAEEIEQFGPDLIDVVKRAATEAVTPYVDQKFGEVAASVKQVGENASQTDKRVAQSDQDRLYARLDTAVPNWETVNKDETFLQWLREEEPYTGKQRGQLLSLAFQRNDAERVVKIFQGFQKEHVADNSDPNDVAPTPEVPVVEPQQTLDELVAPGTPKTGSVDAQAESGNGRIWTQTMITDFYEHRNELIKKAPNKELPDEIQALERDLAKAQSEGRIR